MTRLLHHRPDAALATEVSASLSPKARVIKQTTLEALETHRKPDGSRAVALVFASARTPGGGWRTGVRGQEEDLCRATELGRFLESTEARPFYEFHETQGALGSDWCIYLPKVPVLGADWTASFIVSAAPNARYVYAITDREKVLAETIGQRAARVLEVAAHHGHRTLILGAWGLGHHRNDPAHVLDAFSAAISRPSAIEEVVFAVPGPPALLERFRERFADPSTR